LSESQARGDWPPLPARIGPRLAPGDPVPVFESPASNNPRYQFSSVGGVYIVLCFFGSAANERSRVIIERLIEGRRARFDDSFASFFGVSVDPADKGRLAQSLPGVRYFWDFESRVTSMYGAEGGCTVIIDPFLRTIANVPFGEPEAHVRAVEAVLDSLPPPGEHAGADIPAPVLVLPRARTLRRLADARTPQGVEVPTATAAGG